MLKIRQITLALLLTGSLLVATGCQSRFMTNRYYDFRDTLNLGVGATHENNLTGMWPPSLGVYVEATDFLQLGAITHNGMTAETEMRGSGTYLESRTRLGLLFWQALNINQDYREGCTNYFKQANTLWEDHMRSPQMQFAEKPAKSLNHRHWANDMQYGAFLMHRGYQYWEYTGVELALCDPFLTHWGFTVRAGVDISEFSDFLLGWFGGYDFKHDDLDEAMFAEKNSLPLPMETVAPCDPAEMERLRQQNADLAARNQQLQNDLARIQGELNSLKNGVEIVLPMSVLFDSGSNRLREEGKALLARVADTIRSQYPGHTITVEGHTDDRPIVQSRKLWRDNWDLGAGRATAVVRYMINEQGLPKQYFAATTYADNKPLAPNTTADGRQENRRSVIVLRAITK